MSPESDYGSGHSERAGVSPGSDYGSGHPERAGVSPGARDFK